MPRWRRRTRRRLGWSSARSCDQRRSHPVKWWRGHGEVRLGEPRGILARRQVQVAALQRLYLSRAHSWSACGGWRQVGWRARRALGAGRCDRGRQGGQIWTRLFANVSIIVLPYAKKKSIVKKEITLTSEVLYDGENVLAASGFGNIGAPSGKMSLGRLLSGRTCFRRT